MAKRAAKIQQYSRDELLNSYECPIKFQGRVYKSVDEIFKVYKTKSDNIIYEILLCKLLQNPEITQELLDTAFSTLEDTKDLPGTVLMQIREQIRNIR